MSARVRWIGAIVGLLVGNILATGGLIAASHRGGSRVIPFYYDRAVHYDDAIDGAARTAALGWQVELRVVGGLATLVGTDRGGNAVVHARVTIDVVPRAPSGRPATLSLGDAGGGTYRAQVAIRPGWYDATITIERGRDTYARALAFEAR